MSLRFRIFLVFALGYFTSFVLRGLNIGFAPFISRDIGLSSGELGFLTSLYFLGFAAAQIPGGVLLDRYGERRTDAGLLLVTAVGLLLFAGGAGLPALMAGRLLIGIGVSVAFASAGKAVARSYAARDLPLLYSALLAIGGFGGVLVGTPLTALLRLASWRTICLGLALFTVAVAVAILLGTPEAREPEHRRAGFAAQLRGTLAILRWGYFWRVVPFSALTQGVFYATQSLWVGAYMRDVSGLDAREAAFLVSLLGLALVVGSIIFGLAARALERRGLSVVAFSGIGMGLFVADQILIVAGVPLPAAVLWIAYGFFGGIGVLTYAVLTEVTPLDMVGRVNTTFTLFLMFLIFAVQAGIGAALSLWPSHAGSHPAGAHRLIWSALVLVELACAVPYLLPRRADRPIHLTPLDEPILPP